MTQCDKWLLIISTLVHITFIILLLIFLSERKIKNKGDVKRRSAGSMMIYVVLILAQVFAFVYAIVVQDVSFLTFLPSILIVGYVALIKILGLSLILNVTRKGVVKDDGSNKINYLG